MFLKLKHIIFIYLFINESGGIVAQNRSSGNTETKKASVESQIKYEFEKKEQVARGEQKKKDLKAEEEKQK